MEFTGGLTTLDQLDVDAALRAALAGAPHTLDGDRGQLDPTTGTRTHPT